MKAMDFRFLPVREAIISVLKMRTKNSPKFIHLFYTGVIFSLASVNPSSPYLLANDLNLNRELQIFQKCSIQVVLNTLNSKDIPSEDYNLTPLSVPATQTIFTYAKGNATKIAFHCDNSPYKLTTYTQPLQKKALAQTKCFAWVYIDPKPCRTWGHRKAYFREVGHQQSSHRRRNGRINSVREGQYFIHVVRGGAEQSDNSENTSFWYDISFLMGFHLRSTTTTFPTSILFEIEQTNGNRNQGHYFVGKTSVYDRNIFGSNVVGGRSSKVRDNLSYPLKHPFEMKQLHTLADLDKLSYSKFSSIHWIFYSSNGERENSGNSMPMAARLINTLSLNSTLHPESYMGIEGIPTVKEIKKSKFEGYSGGPSLFGEDGMKSIMFLTCASIHVEDEMKLSIFLRAFDHDIWKGILSLGIASGILLQFIDSLRRRISRICRISMSRIRRGIEQKIQVLGEGLTRNLQDRKEVREERSDGFDVREEVNNRGDKEEGCKVIHDNEASDEKNCSSGISLGSGRSSDGNNRRSSAEDREEVELVVEDRSDSEHSTIKDCLNTADSSSSGDIVENAEIADEIEVEEIMRPRETPAVAIIAPTRTTDNIPKEVSLDVSVTGGIDLYYPQRRQHKRSNLSIPPKKFSRKIPGMSVGAKIGNLTFVYTFLLAQRTKLVHTSKFLCGSWALVGIILTYSYKQKIGSEMRESMHFYPSYNWFDQLVSDNFTIYSPFSMSKSFVDDYPVDRRTMMMTFGVPTKLGDAVDVKMRYWYQQGTQLRDRIYRPDSQEEMLQYLENPRGFVSNVISKCGHTAFSDSYDNLVQFQVELYREYGILAKIGYESFPSSEEVTDWQFENVPWPPNLFSWKLKALQESGLVKLWKDLRERRYVDMAMGMSDLIDLVRRQSRVHPVSLKDHILIVFYLYLWMILGCGVAWMMEHVWRVVVWLGRKCWGKYGVNWERFYFVPKIF